MRKISKTSLKGWRTCILWTVGFQGRLVITFEPLITNADVRNSQLFADLHAEIQVRHLGGFLGWMVDRLRITELRRHFS